MIIYNKIDVKYISKKEPKAKKTFNQNRHSLLFL